MGWKYVFLLIDFLLMSRVTAFFLIFPSLIQPSATTWIFLCTWDYLLSHIEKKKFLSGLSVLSVTSVVLFLNKSQIALNI